MWIIDALLSIRSNFNLDFESDIPVLHELVFLIQTCLTPIIGMFSENTFASGSIDGTIILWKTDNLLPFRYFNSIPEYEGPHKTFPYSVQYMTCVESVSTVFI